MKSFILFVLLIGSDGSEKVMPLNENPYSSRMACEMALSEIKPKIQQGKILFCGDKSLYRKVK